MKKLLFFTMLAVVAFMATYTTASPVSAQTLDCGSADFQDVQPDPANSAYPDPELSVNCDGSSMTVTSNGIPNYEFVAITPGNLTARTTSWSIPLTPSGSKEDVPLLGDAGVLVNGIPIYGPNEGGNLGFGDPVLDNILDFCNGHVGPTGYHNHAPPECIFDNYENNAGLVVGYSLDGWPILAPFECTDASCSTVVELKSSWQLTDASVTAAWDKHSYVAGSGDLDECNGKAQPDGSYAYYATATFPYFMGCYVNGDYSTSGSTTTTATTTSTTSCVIPASGPWPTCATNGSTAATATSTTTATSSGCIIPDSGPWPACARTGGAIASTPASTSGGSDCVIPVSGPWPACATNGSVNTSANSGATAAPNSDCVIPASGPWPACATSGNSSTATTAPAAGQGEPPANGQGEPPADGEGNQGPPPQGEGGQGEQPCRPNLATAAATLGITEAELLAALGTPPPDIDAAAATLGISAETLSNALDSSCS